jgi:hypothetical protein
MTDPSTSPGRLHPRIQAIVPDTGIMTPFFFKWLVSLWERTGGYDDVISTIENTGYSFIGNALLSDDQTEEILDFQAVQKFPTPQDFISRSINANYTASPYEVVSMTVAGTISLPPYPTDNDKNKLFNKNGKRITLSGNGNTIDGETSIITVRKNTLLSVQYFAEIGEWVMV